MLHEHGIDNMRAPYSQLAQLSHLDQQGYCHAVWSGTDLLMFGGCHRVITDIDLDA